MSFSLTLLILVGSAEKRLTSVNLSYALHHHEVWQWRAWSWARRPWECREKAKSVLFYHIHCIIMKCGSNKHGLGLQCLRNIPHKTDGHLGWQCAFLRTKSARSPLLQNSKKRRRWQKRLLMVAPLPMLSYDLRHQEMWRWRACSWAGGINISFDRTVLVHLSLGDVWEDYNRFVNPSIYIHSVTLLCQYLTSEPISIMDLPLSLYHITKSGWVWWWLLDDDAPWYTLPF